ncbi:MAG: bifunctional phosphopantothenoylcysteine decarboxylase/phosphopantothenate--cysteine ligase CoaBC [Herpetosiphonaceae bacterium]|nr:bifunctional phosphopantothenoylcysteine decarboxylase/phosphopantothenate--cysteine ligase CoaBC [Herpetosiphonaceae bacterium]
MDIVAGKRILLGVSGSVACYKLVDVARQWTQAGALVDVVMTKEATNFVAPLLFHSLTYRPVYTEMWTTLENAAAHVALGAEADVVVIAPATAQTIARIVGGFCDDLLTSAVLATTAPLCLAPAMNVNMYNNVATQANLATLSERDWTILEPDDGLLASGLLGKGRLPAGEAINGMVRAVLGRHYGRMAGRRVVVTAGGTHEPLDPVRFIGNRSSGQMGYALASVARDEGATVTLISGPVGLPSLHGVRMEYVETAAEMYDAVHRAVGNADLLCMAAAVADYRPAQQSSQKIKKNAAQRELVLEPTIDILASLSEFKHCIKVGFAAETEHLLAAATDKLQRKQLDLIVANDAVSSIGRATSAVTLIDRFGVAQSLPSQHKAMVATAILDAVLERWPNQVGRIINKRKDEATG